MGTGQVTERLPVPLTPREPAVTLEAEGLVTRVVPHVDVAQVPAGKDPCGTTAWGMGAERAAPLSAFCCPRTRPLAVQPHASSLSSLGLAFLVDEMKRWIRWVSEGSCSPEHVILFAKSLAWGS